MKYNLMITFCICNCKYNVLLNQHIHVFYFKENLSYLLVFIVRLCSYFVEVTNAYSTDQKQPNTRTDLKKYSTQELSYIHFDKFHTGV